MEQTISIDEYIDWTNYLRSRAFNNIGLAVVAFVAATSIWKYVL